MEKCALDVKHGGCVRDVRVRGDCAVLLRHNTAKDSYDVALVWHVAVPTRQEKQKTRARRA